MSSFPFLAYSGDYKCVTAEFSALQSLSLCWNGFSKTLGFAFCQIFTSFFFNGKNSVKLELALVRTSSPFHYASLFKIVLRLAMFHSGIFSLEILKYSSHVFKWLLFEPCFKSLHVRFPGNILTTCTVRGLEILIQITFCTFDSPVLAMFHSRHFGLGIRNYR